MGFGLSRPQYSYVDRLRPVEYFTTCDPSSCFCGVSHSRERQLIASRGPYGQEIYRDPLDVMNSYLTGGRFGRPTMGMDMGMAMSPGLIGQPMMTAPGILSSGVMPGMSAGLISGQPMGVHGAQHGQSVWPAEWKEPDEWTTRDYDRLAQIMQELVKRQGGFQIDSRRRRISSQPAQDPGFVLEEGFDIPYETGTGRPRLRIPEIEQLQAQMMQFIAESQKQIQAMSELVCGSEREIREERYRERQRKMTEEILKTWHEANAAPSSDARPHPFMPQSPMGINGSMPPFSMPIGMNAMMGEQDGWASRPVPPRRSRRTRGTGFGDDADDIDRRRQRRSRLGFDDIDDDLFNLGGDDRHSPSRPRGGRRPRPDRGDGGGSGAYFANDLKDEDRGRKQRRDERTVKFASPDREPPSEPDDLAAWTNARFSSPTIWPTSPPPMPPMRTAGGNQYTYSGIWPNLARTDARAGGSVNRYAQPGPSPYSDRPPQGAAQSGQSEGPSPDGYVAA